MQLADDRIDIVTHDRAIGQFVPGIAQPRD
jgi:hypothetical protein